MLHIACEDTAERTHARHDPRSVLRMLHIACEDTVQNDV